MLCLTCNMISSIDLARYGLSHAKDLGIRGLWYKCSHQSQVNPNADFFFIFSKSNLQFAFALLNSKRRLIIKIVISIDIRSTSTTSNNNNDNNYNNFNHLCQRRLLFRQSVLRTGALDVIGVQTDAPFV